LFIDASQHFEKVKTQNVLRAADIAKIVSCYKARANEDKYSYVAPLSEITENDYNLNIPRYVDTFEEEEAVNLKVVSKELKKLKVDMKSTDATIAEYCKELGIESPF
jgi:type I restriction enzyme M protein